MNGEFHLMIRDIVYEVAEELFDSRKFLETNGSKRVIAKFYGRLSDGKA